VIERVEERAYARRGATESSVDALKVPPHSVEAEQSVIGGLLLDNRAWDRVGDVLTADDFYRREHKLIFNAIASLCEEAGPADVVTVSERLEKTSELDGVGGLSYLASIANNTPSAANISAYANIVRERSVLRQLLRAASDITASTYAPEGRGVRGTAVPFRREAARRERPDDRTPRSRRNPYAGIRRS